MDGQLSIIQETLKRDNPMDTVYNNTLGWVCPVCGGISKLKDINYCPGCGQRLKLLSPQQYNEKHPDETK